MPKSIIEQETKQSFLKKELMRLFYQRKQGYPTPNWIEIDSAIQKATEEAEKRIDEIKPSVIFYCEDCEEYIINYGAHNSDHTIQTIKLIEEAKQILNDCFGVGK